jgi:hypothetical protein
MNSHRFTNARVHEWLTPDLEDVARAMRSTRVQLNSAAVWWFCRRLTVEQRAEILGEFVKHQALQGAGGSPAQAADGMTPRRGRKPKAAE